METSGKSLCSVTRSPPPAGACDCHVHVFGPAKRFPFAEHRNYTPPMAPLSNLVSHLDRLRLDRAVIVQPSVYGTDNACTLDAVARLEGRARAVAVVSPDTSWAELQSLGRAGVRGVRFNLIHGDDAALDSLEDMANRVAPLGWHVQIYMLGAALPEVEERLRRLPAAIVLDHMVRLDTDNSGAGQACLLRLVEAGNTWVKLCPYRADGSGPPFAVAGRLARRLASMRPDRLIWGTDWPHPDYPENKVPRDEDLLAALNAWFDDAELFRQILVENPEVLYGFEERHLGA